jgi:hypothetical protein
MTQFVSALNSINPLVHGSIDGSSVFIHNVKFLEEVEVCQVEHVAVQLLEVYLGDLVHRSEIGNRFSYFGCA